MATSFLAASFLAPQADAAPCGDGSSLLRRAPADVQALVTTMAPTYSLDPMLVLALIAAESNFNPTAVSRKGARGLMQLMDATAARFGVVDPFNPEANVNAGMRYLRELLDAHNGNVMLSLASYNAGPGAIKRHGGVPPFPETRQYVDRIHRFMGCSMFVSAQPAVAPVARAAPAAVFQNPWAPPTVAPSHRHNAYALGVFAR